MLSRLPSDYYYLFFSSLELSDTKVYEPSIRALLRTASHFCEVTDYPHPSALKASHAAPDPSTVVRLIRTVFLPGKTIESDVITTPPSIVLAHASPHSGRILSHCEKLYQDRGRWKRVSTIFDRFSAKNLRGPEFLEALADKTLALDPGPRRTTEVDVADELEVRVFI